MLLLPLLKLCTKCKINKPYSGFCKDKYAKDGLNYQCKLCRMVFGEKYRLNNPDYNKQHRLNNPEYYKEKGKQYRIDNPEYGKQYRIDNVESLKQLSQIYYKKNAEIKRQYQREYRQTEHGRLVSRVNKHKRRITLRVHTFGKHHTIKDVMDKFKLQYGKCIYCESSIKDYYEIDHIIPPCDGGGNEAWNIQLLCKECNQSKFNKPAHEFAQKHGKLV